MRLSSCRTGSASGQDRLTSNQDSPQRLRSIPAEAPAGAQVAHTYVVTGGASPAVPFSPRPGLRRDGDAASIARAEDAEYCRAIPLQLRSPDALDLTQLLDARRPHRGNVAQHRVVEDHIGRNGLRSFCPRPPPHPATDPRATPPA